MLRQRSLILTGIFLAFLSINLTAQDSLVLTDGRFVDGVEIRSTKEGFILLYKAREILVPKAMVKEAFLSGEEGFLARSDEEKAKVARGLIPYRGRWMTKKKRDSKIALANKKRRARFEQLRAHHAWRNRYKKKTKQFRFEYTINPDIFKNLGNLMEAYHKVFMKDWRLSKPTNSGPLRVCFYHDYETFLQVGGVGHGVQGYYLFQPRTLNFFYNRYDPDHTIEVMFHEMNHYLTHLIDLEFMYPHNINEAMAEYYGASKWDAKKKKMTIGGIQEGRLTEVWADIDADQYPKLEDFLADRLDYKDYTWGWTFVHFMMETPRYSKKFKKFFLELARDKDIKRTRQNGLETVAGQEVLEAFKKKMKIKDIGALQDEWYAYIKNNLELKTHRGYARAAQSAYQSGRPIRATRFFELAIKNDSKNPQVYRQYADLLLGKKELDRAETMIKKAIELDPIDSDSYLKLSRLRFEQGKIEACLLLRKLVMEMDPDNADVYFEVEIETEEEVDEKKELSKMRGFLLRIHRPHPVPISRWGSQFVSLAAL